MERRSIRKYNEKPVTEEQLTEILEAGRYAPTGGNCQTVHFVVIMNAKIRANLRKLVQEAFLQMELSICGALALENYVEKQSVKSRTGMKVDYIR